MGEGTVEGVGQEMMKGMVRAPAAALASSSEAQPTPGSSLASTNGQRQPAQRTSLSVSRSLTPLLHPAPVFRPPCCSLLRPRRYYACEALYNIAKVARETFLFFFNDAFDAMFRCEHRLSPSCLTAALLVLIWGCGHLVSSDE